MFALLHANGDAAYFLTWGDNIEVIKIIGGEVDAPALLPREVARGLWKALVAQGFRRDRDAEGDYLAELHRAELKYSQAIDWEDDDSERYAETYNDARMFGYDHDDAAFCASQHVRGEAY